MRRTKIPIRAAKARLEWGTRLLQSVAVMQDGRV